MTSSDQAQAILEVRGVTKRFANGTLALRGVDLTIQQGSVHGLVGANGAGKSTLIKCVSGVQPVTTGSISWRGEVASWHDPGHAQRAGLTTIHQHVPLVPTLTTLENVFLSRPGPWR